MEKVLIETERLWLRELHPNDAADLYTLNADPDVLQYTGDIAFAHEEAARLFVEGYHQYRLFNRGRWAVIRKADHAFLGWCGLKYHPDNGDTDLGFRLMKQYWNQGYTTEAAMACLQYAFEQLKLPEVVAQVRTENKASVKVLRKLGMHQVAATLFDGKFPGWRYALRREEWGK